MSFGILRRFLNLAASNSKSIQIRRFLNTAASDPKSLRNRNGKRKKGSQLRDAVSVQDGISIAGLFLVHESISKADAENLRRELGESLRKFKDYEASEDYETKKEDRLKLNEELKRSEEEAEKEHKLLLQELEELMEELRREKSYPNI
ncbi:hypothetical protein FNV43_RR14260 [Rhamnella rubrinervis]|uniref:Uncharacterized protein n=1 Tax=Rhamnella rubrinervis TaxID=2594499 RepID=A0A8K0H2Y7_9ROSA|nr:hypothetical protein FNV43_RR14260 [Rhamnella rubrinervis]